MSLRARRVLDACIIHCWSKPLADSGASVQPRNQSKNQRENSWRLESAGQHFMTIALQELNWVSNLHGTRFKQRMCGAASVSMGFFYMHCHFTTPVQTRRQPKRTIFWEENFRVHMIHHLRHNDKSLFTEKLEGDPWTSALPKEMNGEEVWQMHRLRHILINTAKERISEDVVGNVAFASVSSRSMDRDPIWTPCDRSCYGTFQIWPRHLAKLQTPGKTWKTSFLHGSLAHRIAKGMHTGQPGPSGPICK